MKENLPLVDKLWDKQEKDTTKSYTAFCDYRDMGTGRSLRALVKQYLAQYNSNSQAKPPARTEQTIFAWSTKNNWQKRIAAWDNEQTTLRTKEHELARKQIIEEELRDYRAQLAKWLDLFERTPLHEVNYKTKNDDGSVTEFQKINHVALHQITRWRDDITKQGRRALGMPEKVTESTHKVITWQDRVIEDIRNERITFSELEGLFDNDLAIELFARAGKSVQVSEIHEQA